MVNRLSNGFPESDELSVVSSQHSDTTLPKMSRAFERDRLDAPMRLPLGIPPWLQATCAYQSPLITRKLIPGCLPLALSEHALPATVGIPVSRNHGRKPMNPIAIAALI